MESTYLSYDINSMFTAEVCEPGGEYISPLELAERLVSDTGANIFLTGKAGTGKTTFLHNLASSAKKRMVILAPTGVAAINAGGSTIHSFFQLSFGPYIPGMTSKKDKSKVYSFNKTKKRIIRTLDLLVIDEISMVRPDVLDAIDELLRRMRNPRKPFGGVQLLLIGDLRQLAPVVQPAEWELLAPYYKSPYFFESMALQEAGYLTVELTKVFRQQDPVFIDILNKVRDNSATQDTLDKLNSRVSNAEEIEAQHGIIRLTTHNYLADSINNQKMEALKSDIHIFDAVIEGNFPESSYPAEEHLLLKVGAQVMFIKNDPDYQKRYYNGMIGTISAITSSKVYVRPHDDTLTDIEVTPVSWNNVRYSLDESDGSIKDEVEGTFTQIPLRPAWAITIHKSQGLTFDKALIDASRSFAPGQTYVALSRCRTLEGLYLERPLSSSSIMTDGVVNAFISLQSKYAPDSNVLNYYSQQYHNAMLHELFDFSVLHRKFEALHRILVTELASTFPKLIDQADAYLKLIDTEMLQVARKFHDLINALTPYRNSSKEAADKLDIKTRGGAKYFSEFLVKLINFLKIIPTDLDNKLVAKRLTVAIEETNETADILLAMLKVFSEQKFSTNLYLTHRAQILLSIDGHSNNAKVRTSKKRTGISAATVKDNDRSAETTEDATEVPDARSSVQLEDIVNPEIYEKLKRWRFEKSKENNNLPLYMIISNKSILELAAKMPKTTAELKNINGIGKRKIQQYGEEIVNLLWPKELT